MIDDASVQTGVTSPGGLPQDDAVEPSRVGGRSRVAVVIPCFNDGATLPETIDSLAGEERHELVIVDDGSTDEATLSLLRELESAGVKVLRQERGGPARARMAGVAATTAPYVFPLDADDVLCAGALATLAHALDTDRTLCAVWGDHVHMGDDQRYVRTVDVLDPWQESYVNSPSIVAMVRREALLAVGGWTLEGGWEDWDVWLSFAERGFRGQRVDRIVFRYRRHADRRTHRSWSGAPIQYEQLRRRHTSLYEGRRELVKSSPYRALRPWFELVDALPWLSVNKRLVLFSMALKTMIERSPKPVVAMMTRSLRSRARRLLASRRGSTRRA